MRTKLIIDGLPTKTGHLDFFFFLKVHRLLSFNKLHVEKEYTKPYLLFKFTKGIDHILGSQ
jgi:hypothetical protein